jgi:hypothetical protein
MPVVFIAVQCALCDPKDGAPLRARRIALDLLSENLVVTCFE